MLREAGIDETKPLYAVLMTTMEAVSAAREAVKGGARGLTPEGERDLIHRVVETVGVHTEHHVDRLAWRIGFWNTAKLALAGVMLCVAGYGVGRVQNGWPSAPVIDLGDQAALRSYCLKHAMAQTGGTACELPMVWVRR